MKTIIIASGNKNKKREIRAILKGFKLKVLSLEDIPRKIPPVLENGKTFKENAVKKAVAVSKILKGLILADDSGIEVHCLSGRPGVRSARFAGVNATDIKNNGKLLKLMENTAHSKRKAAFVCAMAAAEDGKLIKTVEGRCRGFIGREPKGYNGFGYDPLFTPAGYKLTFAEMKPAFKNRISHRGIALKKMKEFIGKYL
jgi:XTP/dITP diphosphohydrolase